MDVKFYRNQRVDVPYDSGIPGRNASYDDNLDCRICGEPLLLSSDGYQAGLTLAAVAMTYLLVLVVLVTNAIVFRWPWMKDRNKRSWERLGWFLFMTILILISQIISSIDDLLHLKNTMQTYGYLGRFGYNMWAYVFVDFIMLCFEFTYIEHIGELPQIRYGVFVWMITLLGALAGVFLIGHYSFATLLCRVNSFLALDKNIGECHSKAWTTGYTVFKIYVTTPFFWLACLPSIRMPDDPQQVKWKSRERMLAVSFFGLTWLSEVAFVVLLARTEYQNDRRLLLFQGYDLTITLIRIGQLVLLAGMSVLSHQEKTFVSTDSEPEPEANELVS